MHLFRITMALVMFLFVFQVKSGDVKQKLQNEIKQHESKMKSIDSEKDSIKRQLIKARLKLQAEKKKGTGPVDKTQFYIPRMKKAPIIDGIVGEKEWTGAVEVPLTTGIYGMMERKSANFYIGWDPEYIYFGQRMPLRKGEKLKRLNRAPIHDNVYCGETSLEVYIDRKSSGSHPSKCRWQFMGNAVGNKWDREDQYEIGQNFIDWNGDWIYKQRLTPDGKYWEGEIAIPRKTVYQKTPIKDGDIWKIGIASNLHNPWMFSGFYRWNIPITFKDSVPQIRMYNPQKSLTERAIAFGMDIKNTTSKKFNAKLVIKLTDQEQKNLVFEKKFPFSLEPGRKKKFNINDKCGNKIKNRTRYTMSIMVLQGDKSLYTWSYPIAYNSPDNKHGLVFTPDKNPFGAKTFYNPLSNFIRVFVDKYDFVKKDQVKKAVFSIRPVGSSKVIASGELDKFSYGTGETNISTPPDLPIGKYECVFKLVDKNGKILAKAVSKFEKKDHKKEFPWLFNNKIGEDDVVLKPFKPLKAAGNIIKTFKKQIMLDGIALPEKIEAAGVNLLAGPIAFQGKSRGVKFTVKADGEASKGFLGLFGGDGPKLVDNSETHADYKGSGAGGPLKIKTDVHWEYDSTAKVTIILEPTEQGGKVKLDNLKLVIPFTKEGGINFIANGLNMRLSNVAGTIPGKGKIGKVWDSKRVPYQKMTVGSFIPFVWVGNLNSGLTWFADNDKGWWPNDKHPAIEIDRTKDGRVNLVLNIASEAVEFSEPREITFGLNVNPVRPFSEHKSSPMTFGSLVKTGRWDPKTSRKRKEFAKRYPDNLKLNKRYIELAHKYGEIYAPYTEMSYMDFPKEAVEYFKEEWGRKGNASSPIFNKSSNDCLLYWTEKWIKDAGLDGYYFDNIYNKINWNIHYGTAYKLPDGRIQPGYNLWGMRSHIKRIRTVLQHYKREPSRICIHNTRFQFAPIMAFADIAMGGEMGTPRGDNPNAGDFMDMYPRDFMDVMYNVPLWGYKLSHLYHYKNRTFVDETGKYDQAKAMKVHRSAMATMLVHGVEFFQGLDYKNLLKSKFQMLKKLPGGKFEFIPSWKAKGLFKLEGRNKKDLEVAVYKKKDVLLLIIANYSKRMQTARVWMDFPKLINMPKNMDRRYVLDFETMEFAGHITEKRIKEHKERLPRIGGLQYGHPTMNMTNILRVKVQAHDFRIILIANLPPVQGSGF